MKCYSLFSVFLLVLSGFLCNIPVQAQETSVDLLIVGGGASGTAAGIQAARMGTNTLIIEETEWLGGMLTAAGVSAIDGNHKMPSGFWGEFRQKLYAYYGGPEAVETGWVSNTLFEPKVGNQLLKEMARHPKLNIWYDTKYVEAERKQGGWQVTVRQGGRKRRVFAKLLLDATELGDVMAAVGVPYDIGMDSREETGERFAPEKANDIIQDMTYVAVLQDYGPGSDKTIPKPKGYDPAEFRCSCDVSDPAGDGSPQNDCEQMITYARLPNNKYMINWPKCGNDIYLNLIEKSPKEREEALKQAKLHTLRFVYYLQQELGFKHLGIAANEFPTKDHLPMLPYHRESRRMKGLVTLTLNHMADPYSQPDPLYRTGIAVGDYTIDHHHLKNPDAPEIEFVKIKVPSYNVPLGALIPAKTDGLIVAEKSISVTNIVNGATRLQPVVLGIGQAAGALAAVSIRNGQEPREVQVREVQQALLDSKAYLMPFIDVKPDDKDFAAIQRIGATGILQGTGIAYKWANQTWFYPERAISEFELVSGLKRYYKELNGYQASGAPLTVAFLGQALQQADQQLSQEAVTAAAAKLIPAATPETVLNRRQAAVLLDQLLKPFEHPVAFDGSLIKPAPPQ